MQRGRLAVDADVGDVAAGADQRGGQLEGRRHADGLDGDVGAETVGELADDAPTASSRPLLTTTSAPNCLAASSRLSARSMATMWLGLKSRAPMMAASPIGPAPTTATTSPGWTRPLRTPTS